MTVVSDTTPLNYLVLIGHQDLLPELYHRVLIPDAVFEELRSDAAPSEITAWIADPPIWLEIKRAGAVPAELVMLGPGEREAIALAEALKADLLILDDRDARREATRRSLRVTGTLGVLDEAAARGLIDLSKAINRLEQTSFRASPEILRTLRHGQRR